MGIIFSLVILLLVVAIHEGGHYLVMRRNGVRVDEFSVGLGPPLFQWKTATGTVISIRALPIGGYVRPSPLSPGKPDSGIGIAYWETTTGRWARFRIYMAGMFMNALTPFIAMSVLFYATGRVPTVLYEWSVWAPPVLRPLACAFLGSFGIWLATPVLIVVLAVKMGSAFFAGTAGPIGIIMMGNQAAASGQTADMMVYGMVMFFAMISGAIAGFNLVPLFPLDGGRVAAMLIEKIVGRPDSAAERRFKIGGSVLMFAFFILVIASDLLKLLVRH